MIKRLSLIIMLGGTLLAGCQRSSVSEQDSRDHESPLIRRALEREQVGDLDGAIATYEEVLQETPKLTSAHFHLALLLQDYRKDYMGAIYHYRQYERLRPDSEKKALLRERTRICQQLLVAQMLSSGDVAISRKQIELVTEIDKLNKRLSLLEGEKSTLSEQKEALERQLAEQKSETDRLRRLLDRVMPSSAAEEPHSVLPRLNPSTTLQAPPVTPPPAVVSVPAAPVAEPPVVAKPVAPSVLAPPPLLKATVPAAAPSEPEPVHPAPMPITAATRTYVVQPGDSVYRIAERVYGEPMQWKKIRDANKDRLGPDNQVRVGQVLLIP